MSSEVRLYAGYYRLRSNNSAAFVLALHPATAAPEWTHLSETILTVDEEGFFSGPVPVQVMNSAKSHSGAQEQAWVMGLFDLETGLIKGTSSLLLQGMQPVDLSGVIQPFGAVM